MRHLQNNYLIGRIKLEKWRYIEHSKTTKEYHDAIYCGVHLGETTDDDKHILFIDKLYDFTKGGTDIMDQKMNFYAEKCKIRRWTMIVFPFNLRTLKLCKLKHNNVQKLSSISRFLPGFGTRVSSPTHPPYISCFEEHWFSTW